MSNNNIEFKENLIKAERGISFYDLIFNNRKYGVRKVAICKLNGKYYELSNIINEDGDVELIPFETDLGMKIYIRTLQFIFIKAALDIFPNAKIKIEHSINNALYGEILMENSFSIEDIKIIKDNMKSIIKADIPINKVTVTKQKAMEIFKSYNMIDKIKLLNNFESDKVNLYELDGRYDYFYGSMAYSAGIIRAFDLLKYMDGFILRRPKISNLETLEEFKGQKSLANVFIETEKWLNILGISEVGTLNEKVINNELTDVVMVSEALHEKKIANIADQVLNKGNVKIILIAGPSSSGKTTFSKRLSIQLKVNGLIPIPLSLDDYFVNREDTPKDENGEYDYESINALDLDLLNDNLLKVLKGNEVSVPTYNFKVGKKEWRGNIVKIPENGVLILEGIHGLNPKLISKISKENIFRIYISALTQLNIDNHNRISTTDVRKVRRIVRDSLSRGYGAEETLKMWPSIKKGEKNNIFVYQESAEAIFNSTLVYELCVLKPYALKELEKIDESSNVYAEAIRLKSFLNLFKEINVEKVPNNSLLREFIGGSYFYEY